MEMHTEMIGSNVEHTDRVELRETGCWGRGVRISACIAGEEVGWTYVHLLYEGFFQPLGIISANISTHWQHKDVETDLIRKAVSVARNEGCFSLVFVSPEPRDEDAWKRVRKLQKRLKDFGFVKNGTEFRYDFAGT